jgi:uncharacterized protein YbaA (DUF1428 family)
MKYVDGYVLPVPVKKLKAYARMALTSYSSRGRTGTASTRRS